MTLPSWKKILLYVTVPLALLCGLVFTVLVARLHELDTYKDQLLVEIRKELNRPVTYGTGEVSLRFGPAFTFTDVQIQERDGSTPFATVAAIRFRLAILPLLEKKVILRRVELEKPVVQLVRNKDGTLNIDDLLRERETKSTIELRVRGVRVKQGNLIFTDHATVGGPLVTTLREADLFIGRLVRGKESPISLEGRLVDGKSESPVAIEGKLKLPARNAPLTTAHLDARVSLHNINASHYWPYYSNLVPFQRMSGRFNLDCTVDGTPLDFTSKGSLQVAGLRFVYPEVFRQPLTPADVRLAYSLTRTPKEVNISSVDFRMDGLTVKGGCAVKDIHTSDPRIVAWTTIAPFRLEKFFYYIPFGIIADDASQFIEQHIKAGYFRVDEGRLDGRVSQILTMEKGENYNVLRVRATALEGAVVDMGDGWPVFNSIKGDLELAGKNFTLRNMSGKFGTTPFTLNGMISDYCLDTPSGYPFKGVFTPRKAELDWLFGKEAAASLQFTGDSILNLSGEGGTASYTFSGDCNLTAAAYSYGTSFAKPAGQVNSLAFRMNLLRNGDRSLSCQYALPPLALSIAARFQDGKALPTQLDISSNQFAMGALTANIPKAKPYHPQGKMQISARAEGVAESLADMKWSGLVALAGASFKPAESVKPLSNVTGTLRFKGNSLESPRLSLMLGSSPLQGKGSLTNFSDPSFTLEVSSPALDLNDLGLRHPRGAVKIQNLQGTLAYQDDVLKIRSLAGKIGSSQLSVKGAVTQMRQPKVDVSVTSPAIDLDDILALSDLERERKQGGEGGTATVKATIDADSASFGKLAARHLHTVAHYENGILYLQPFEFDAYGGRISGTLRADGGGNGSSRYQVKLKADKVSAEPLINAVDLIPGDAIVTGTLSLQADVTARGATMADLRKSLLGHATLRFDDGKMRKFNVLSKVFSILNVSQLLKFQLPDMVKDGMPYSRITGTFAMSDGVISTEDLFIDSNAMNISTVGKIDLVREELAVTVGVQPLQTVDKVVNRIPIVGWILTGKEKHFITTYFEAKGKISNPTVTAIPVKSMSRGVFDIFKRVFQLPAKLITDTGEVVIGN